MNLSEIHKLLVRLALKDGWFRFDGIDFEFASGRKFRYQLQDYPFKVDASESGEAVETVEPQGPGGILEMEGFERSHASDRFEVPGPAGDGKGLKPFHVRERRQVDRSLRLPAQRKIGEALEIV